MKLTFKNKRLERFVFGVNVIGAVLVTASFVALFGFHEPLLPAPILYTVQFVLLGVFLLEKAVRLFNAESMADYWQANWFEAPLLVALVAVLIGAGRGFAVDDPHAVRHSAVGVYLVLQVLFKLCKTTIGLVATGRNPTRMLIASFVVLIIVGAGLLSLPRASACENLSFVDALFTATSAACVTGLVVKDTGQDFSIMGQCVILTLIQLGGLGIVVFGAVFALLLGQAFSVRESVAMQDLLSAQTVGQIGNMIAFVFFGTLVFEVIGAVGMYGMWENVPNWQGAVEGQWFCSIFHSISAFCNAGFSLFSESMINYNDGFRVYLVVCPLIICGGLGFGVLYNLADITGNRIKRFFKRLTDKEARLSMEVPRRLSLQTKVVLTVSTTLIIAGALMLLLFEYFRGPQRSAGGHVLAAVFQSITARTAGFNTVDIGEMSDPSKVILILLMFIGGSPGSTAGGIKTVTLAIIIMTVVTALRKRWEVEMFRRSVRTTVVGTAIAVTMLFVVVLFTVTLALSITERAGGFGMSDIMFESASALGTVGLSTGITPALSTAGKLIIIATMLIGRLGPLTLLAALTFNLKPVKYNYPDEALVVG